MKFSSLLLLKKWLHLPTPSNDKPNETLFALTAKNIYQLLSSLIFILFTLMAVLFW
ncbi:hypothetical protein Q4574_19400 [Aliiglaciecola sp. 3_MG-2023]|uniref:hypothetical protein n=1 Tax=Aliiglaciecola sp. 3_MG-2023 TaxID=3062644 RepID=UPI0026E20FDD|nr:hypothetical protein [Aliiglaciecola sp. 3_MG-2023]MDO6695474.1 hypothetical protein [Aliiglaciecola sp. 3_MG-2023]